MRLGPLGAALLLLGSSLFLPGRSSLSPGRRPSWSRAAGPGRLPRREGQRAPEDRPDAQGSICSFLPSDRSPRPSPLPRCLARALLSRRPEGLELKTDRPERCDCNRDQSRDWSKKGGSLGASQRDGARHSHFTD